MPVKWLSLVEAAEQLPDALYRHLADNGSLTRRVRGRCGGGFEVQVIEHSVIQPDQLECDLLGVAPSTDAISRRVYLCCDGHPQIYAQTLIALSEANRQLTGRIQALGSQSLGSLLFRDPLAVKRYMHLACVSLSHPFFAAENSARRTEARNEEAVWVRRSLYVYEGCELIVYEAFIDFPVPVTESA